METYGWTLTEVKKQPYFQLLDILNGDDKKEKQKEEQEVITGRNLAKLFG